LRQSLTPARRQSGWGHVAPTAAHALGLVVPPIEREGVTLQAHVDILNTRLGRVLKTLDLSHNFLGPLVRSTTPTRLPCPA
jgi:hypothetical protein